MSTSILLTLAVNAVLISYIGPVFTIVGCGYDSIIFDRRDCLGDDYKSGTLISLATLAYVFSLATYLVYFFNFGSRVVLVASLATIIAEVCYVSIISQQSSVESWGVGYYFAYVSITLFLFFVMVYKLNIVWLLR